MPLLMADFSCTDGLYYFYFFVDESMCLVIGAFSIIYRKCRIYPLNFSNIYLYLVWQATSNDSIQRLLLI